MSRVKNILAKKKQLWKLASRLEKRTKFRRLRKWILTSCKPHWVNPGRRKEKKREKKAKQRRENRKRRKVKQRRATITRKESTQEKWTFHSNTQVKGWDTAAPYSHVNAHPQEFVGLTIFHLVKTTTLLALPPKRNKSRKGNTAASWDTEAVDTSRPRGPMGRDRSCADIVVGTPGTDEAERNRRTSQIKPISGSPPARVPDTSGVLPRPLPPSLSPFLSAAVRLCRLSLPLFPKFSVLWRTWEVLNAFSTQMKVIFCRDVTTFRNKWRWSSAVMSRGSDAIFWYSFCC